MAEFPKTELIDDIKPVLRIALATVLKGKKQQGKTEELIKYYESIKNVFPLKEMPAILLEVADAYKELHLYGHAYATFLDADTPFLKKGFPPQSLLSLAQCAFEEKATDKDKESLQTFLSKYSKHKDIPLAMFWLWKFWVF